MAVTISWTITDAQAAKIREALAFHQGVDPADIGLPELKAALARHVRGWLQNKATADAAASNPIVVDNPLED